MLIKISKELDAKLVHISKSSKIKKEEIIQKIFDGFIERYENKKGPIEVSVEKVKTTDIWLMYMVFKKHYLINFGQEYELDTKQQNIQLRFIKLTKEKLMQAIMNDTKSQIIAIDTEDLVNSYEAILVKMPQWWREKGFTPQSIYKHFEKIITQIKHGKRSSKDALDDFISSLGGR